MNNILLINNKEYFDNIGIIQLPMRNNPEHLPNQHGILFLGSYERGTDHIHDDLEYTMKSISQKEYSYVIIIGKTDDTINKELFIPKNVVRIYANNIDYTHDKIYFFPMGRDFRSIEQFELKSNTNSKREILCYCNYSLNTHPVRTTIYHCIKNKQFIMFEHMGNFLGYNISRDTFFSRLQNSKFIICPRGNALDTFRFYDALYCGCIPIVVRSHHHQYFNDLPILFLENEHEFSNLTEEFLNEQYNILSRRLCKYYSELDLDYWINIVINDLILAEINLCLL